MYSEFYFQIFLKSFTERLVFEFIYFFVSGVDLNRSVRLVYHQKLCFAYHVNSLR